MANEQFDTTKALLGAVNTMLQAINELPIEDEADFDIVLEARQAKQNLINVKRAVLGEGWRFNSDDGYIFPTDPSGYIAVPANVLDVVSSVGDDIIMRDWKLYSRSEMSFVFDTEVKCDVIWDMDFNAITQPLQNYITIRAARAFAETTVGDTNQYSMTADDEEDARLSARRSEGRIGKYNMLNSSYGINNLARL